MDYLEHMRVRLAGEEPFVPGHLGSKQAVRQLARLVGVRTTELYYSGPLDQMKLDWADEFVLKPAFASTSIGVLLLRPLGNDMLLNLVSGQEMSATAVLDFCQQVADRYLGENADRGVFLIEELLRGHDGITPPADVRCYSFQGVIGMVLTEHHIAGPAEAMYFDGDFKPFEDLAERYSVAEKAAHLESIVPAVEPPRRDELLAVARRVSVAVPSAFCRVDLYDTPKGVYLGEITFFPGTFYYRERKIMSALEAERLGALWDEAEARLAGSLDVSAG